MRKRLLVCPSCQEIRAFVSRRCPGCRVLFKKGFLDGYRAEHRKISEERCRRCGRLVAATIGDLCGVCAAVVEFKERRRLGVLSRSDRHEHRFNYYDV